ncbi:unnamed protein product [Thelazia callipaeda]|uniref:Homeobox domain-containing protein n=1 Tax=Thelazia callipaeda TaxID=103827 RepID=A0A0N5D1B2_THECL|nr:unnamed protein product [Thelazia callipaeda]
MTLLLYIYHSYSFTYPSKIPFNDFRLLVEGGGSDQKESLRQSLSRTEAVQNEAYIEGNGVAAAGTIWMNDTGISVCSTNNATASNLPAGMLKRPSDLLIDATTFEKRIKLEANLPDDHKSSMIGIASKTDSMTKMSASPPRSGAVGTTRANAIVSNIDLSIATGNHGQNSCNGQLPRAADMRDPASVETTHPVDPGHDVPSTSVVAGHHHPQQLAGVTAAPSVNNMQALSSVNSLTSEPPGISVGVLTSTGRSEQPTSVTTGSSSSSVVTGATVLAASTVPASPAGAPMLDPFRQAFFGGNSLAALNAAAAVAGSAGSTVGAADFSNLFFHTAPPNAAAAFPFLAAQILQQQHQHQQAQQSMSIGQGSAPPTTVPTGAQPSTSTAPSVGCIQFPSGAALAPQLANAALLGRALPTAAATQPLSVKTKQGRWCGMHIKIAYDILSKKERRSTPQPSVASQSASLPAPPQNSCNLNTMRNAGVTAPFCPPSTSNASMTSLGSGLPSSFPVLAQTGALPSPFSLPFQQFADTSKLVRRSGTPKQSQNRSATTITRSPSSASGLHLQLSGTGNTASGLIAPSLAAGAGSTMPLQGSLPNPLSGVLGSSLPLTPNLPSASASLTNGTSEAAAQAAMFAALQNVQQNAVAAFPNGSLSATPYLLSSAAAPQPHPLSAITSQAQNIYQSQRLFDPSMTAAMFQQMQSMEALRQSAASAQMNSNPAGAGSHVPVSGAPQGAPPQSQPPPSSIDLVRMQMEQQMMDRYMIALSSASGIGSNNTMTASSNFELMRQQLFAAHMRQQSQQTSLEALLEMQRQQQQQLFNVSRGLPSSYTLAGGAPPGSIPGSAAAAAAAAAGLPQGLGAAAGLFNSNLMALGNAANLQQALYNGKNPYSNTLEQLARQKREDDIIQSGR